MLTYEELAKRRTSTWNDEQEWLRGVDAYFRGNLPDGWENSRPRDPFLRGWQAAAKDEVG